MNPKVRLYLPMVLSVWIAFVFIQSLFFKFTDAPETLHIFGTLDEWAAGFGFAGVFAKGGIFSAYVIGSAELVASIILLTSLAPKFRFIAVPGGLFATAIMTGAIYFHLFTPLGVNVQGDSGTLFTMACTVWVSGLVIAWLRFPDFQQWRSGSENG